ncbi:MAG: ribulose-phosphate 3-epimerase [Actinobacteria bacterium]|nr:ribulose-phosphate 3-epimerase [Actinomycetota bacterium]
MKQAPIIAPSILAANFAQLGQEVDDVIKAGAEWIHFDVIDNHYVPNLSFGPLVCDALIKHGVSAPIDVHLMVQPVESLIEQFAKSGAQLITFHPDACTHTDRAIEQIRAHNIQVGLAFNPSRPLSDLAHVMDKIDLILIMSVNPGFGGQSFIEYTLEKIKEARRLIDQSGRNIRLQVDGGINPNNIQAVSQAGADTFVVGSALFGQSNYQDTINTLKRNLSA